MTESTAKVSTVPAAFSGGARLSAFLGALFAGLLVMVIFQSNLNVAVTLLVLDIVAYFFLGFYLYSGREGREAHGDSVYYLGFCLTLASLAIGLIMRGETGDGTKALINTFGYGLIVTACGLVLRIITQNLAGGGDDAKEQTPDDIAQSFRTIGEAIWSSTRDLNDARESFNTKSLAILQDLVESASKIRAKMDSQLHTDTQLALKAIQEVSGESVQAIRRVSEESARKIEEAYQKLQVSSSNAARAVSEAGDSLVESADEFKEGITAIKKTARTMITAAGSMDEAVEKATGGVNKVQEGVEGLTASLKKSEELFRELHELHGLLVKMNASTDQVNVSMAQLATTMRNVAEVSAGAQLDAKRATDEVVKTLHALNAHELV